MFQAEKWMKSTFLLLLTLFLTSYLIVLLDTAPTRAFSAGPDPGVTGGFNEPTCNQSGCHNAYDLNAGRALGLGDLVISGFPKQYESGKTYPIKLAVTHTKDRIYWGFQLAVRAKATAAQAGDLKPTDRGTQMMEKNGIQYIEHTLDGNATNTFDFNWVAPSRAMGEVIVNAAGNAADGGLSPDGDYIYTTSVAMSPTTP
jgi:hypothetical protein